MKALRMIFGAAILFCLLTGGIAQAAAPRREVWTGGEAYGRYPAWRQTHPPRPCPLKPCAYQQCPHQIYPYYQRLDPGYINRVADNSTDPAKVIDAYPLCVGDKNIRRVAHLNANKLKGEDAYAVFADLAESYEGDYLAAYRAGEEARKLGDNALALYWYERALWFNPYYKPALGALRRAR